MNRFIVLAVAICTYKTSLTLEINELNFNATSYNKSVIILSEMLSIEDRHPIYFMSFEIFVNDFLSFEPKTGLVEIDLTVKYKWWDNSSRNHITEDDYSLSILKNQYTRSTRDQYADSFYPAISLPKSAKLSVKNQVRRVDNLEEFFEIVPTDFQKKPRLKSNSKEKLKKVFRQFSSLEQNFIIQFYCQLFFNTNETNSILNFFNIYSFDSMENFPFDSHACDLTFDVVPRQLNMNNLAQLKISKKKKSIKPYYIFPSLKQTENFSEYNRLVVASSNYSWIKREWLLKKLDINYKNGTNIDDPSNIVVRFKVFRRREPQILIFLFPLIIFTFVMFMVFFLPTTNTSEKTIFSFLNLLFLLAFNLYLFKLMIFTYELVKIPLILQYSNCLMVIQLGVFVYTCLVKSMFYTINQSLFNNIEESTHKQVLTINANKTINSLFKFCNSNNTVSDIKNLDDNKLIAHNQFNNFNRHNTLQHSNQTDTFLKLKMPVIVPLTNGESNLGTTRHFVCDCTSMETETDCSQNDHDRFFSIPADGNWVMTKFSLDSLEKNKTKLTKQRKNHYEEKSNMIRLSQHKENETVSSINKEKQIYFIGDRYSSYGLFENEKPKQELEQAPAVNIRLKSNSNMEISKLNMNVKKLVKMEEFNLKEKLIRSEWERKARFCDVICFFLALFLLAICSILIFCVFPSVYFKYNNFILESEK